ncbi:MAG: tRNA uridine-5-carboxymethylaminomethyl(34) synthesis GTPase MnmE [Deltaproteobacteria bacterium]
MVDDTNGTIAAMATSPGESGIGIIRVSGPRALAVADAVFVPASGRAPSASKGFTARYGWVVRRSPSGQETVDEALLTVMRAPKSYTREDVVEISCHGGPVAMRAVLELVLANGCRLAEPGEFTKRAFLNGRIDLAQAEAVLDIIRAKTDAALRVSLGQLKGGLSRELDRIRSVLLACLAPLEAEIDFPGEARSEPARVRSGLDEASGMIAALLEGSARGKAYREGVRAVICGKPNAGKSSLLNALLRQERSIVTPVAGTTRDTVEEVIDIRGIPVRIIDTAGILEPRDLVEKKAMRKTAQSIESADLVILVFDGSSGLDRRDALLMRKLSPRRPIAVVNKSDRRTVARTAETVRGRFPGAIALSAKKGTGIGSLEEAIADRCGCAGVSGSDAAVSNIRHIQTLKKIKKIIDETRNYRDNELLPECLAQNLKDACGLLDRLQGKDFTGDLLERIFSGFCIGK